jgi:hypothetical protein
MTETTIDVDALANEIRRLGGTSVLGCGALAEALMPFLAADTSERDAALEDVADAINRARYVPGGLPERGIADEDPGSQEYARRLARAAIRALKASRSDTVGPEAGK